MRYYIIAGEASGDLHGSNLIQQINLRDSAARIRCWGGDLMQAAGGSLAKHYRKLAFMGFVEVLFNLRTIFRNLQYCKKDIIKNYPDVIILIDYPGFNLRIAKWAKKRGIKVVYYISPQVWAWKANRVHAMKRHIDLMLVILPFEKEYFEKKWQWDVSYVGHPLVKVVDEYKLQEATNARSNEEKKIALLPGSRKQEIIAKLPVMLEVSREFPEYKFVVAKAPGLDDKFYSPLLKAYKNVSSVRNQTYDLLASSQAALVTSGTATLETALFGIPEVVCYKGNKISYQIAKWFLKIKYISLVNLIMDKPVVKELIQDDLTKENVVAELKDLLYNEERKQELQNDYTALRNLLSEGGDASSNAAEKIVQFLKS